MAKLPIYQQQVGQQTAAKGTFAPVDNSMAQGMQQLGQGLSQFAQAQNVLEQREAARYTAEVKNATIVSYAQHSDELARTARDGTEYLKGMGEFLEKEKRAYAESAPSIKSAEATSLYFADFEASVKAKSVGIAAQMNAKASSDTFKNSIDIAKSSVFLDPSSYEKQMEYLAAELEATSLSESAKSQILTDLDKDLNRSRVLGEIRKSPSAAVAGLYANNQGLSSGDHEAMLAQAVRAQEAQVSAALSAQTKVDKQVAGMEKKLQSATAMDGYELAANDALTYDWVTQNRTNMTKQDYKFFLGKLEQPDQTTETDVNVYSDLYSKATTDPELATKIAHDALVNGDLTIGDFNKITGIAQAQNKGELPSSYKQATSYIRSVSRTNELNPPIGAGERYANASDDFNNWYQENPKAAPQEAVEKARDIWKSYALVEGPAIVTSAAPYKSTKPKSDMMMTDLTESARQLKQDFESNKISQEEYKRQQKTLLQWKRYLEGKDG